MPIGGETVGRAYVRILADGSELPGGIRDAIKDSEPSVREGGRDAGRTYADEFQKEYRKSFRGQFGATQRDIFEDINDSFTTSLARLKLADNFFKSKGWKEFKRRLDDEFGEAGVLAGTRLEQRFRDSADLEGLSAAMGRIGQDVRRAQAEIVDATAEQNAALERETRDLINETNRMYDDANRDRIEGERRVARVREQLLQGQGMIELTLIRDVREGYQELTTAVNALERGESKLVLTHRESIARLRELRSHLAELPPDRSRRMSFELDLIDDRLRRVMPVSLRFNKSMADFSDRLGNATGRRSRSEFLHFIGTLTRGFANLITLGPRLVVRIGEEMFTAFTRAGGGVSGLVSAVGALGPLLGGVVAGIAGVAFAAGVLVVALGPLVALMSGLLGIITALASTVVFALIGGLAVLAGSLAPLAAGIGAVVVGLATMSDEMQDRLSKQIRPVTDQFKELGRTIRDELFTDVPRQARLVSQALAEMQPVAAGVARAVRNVATSWAEALAGPGFASFMDTMETFLPRAVRLLGSIAENTAAALGSMFEAATPAITDFLRWLNRVTADWREWAGSIEGQNEVADFLERAADSAKSLGDFLGETLDLLSVLLSAGNEAGNNIFDQMAGAIGRFADHLRENPEALESWFDFAQNLADEIGDLIVDIGELFDELDDENNRQAIQDIIDLVGDFAGALEELQNTIGPLIGPLVTLLGWLSQLAELGAINPLSGVVRGFQGLGDLLGNLHFDFDLTRMLGLDQIASIDWGGLLAGVGRAIVRGIVTPFEGLTGQIRDVVGRIDWRSVLLVGIGAVPIAILGHFAGLAGRILDRIGRVPWLRLVVGMAGIPGAILAHFGGFAGRILDRIGQVPWPRLVQGMAAIPGQILGHFAGLAGRILDRIGSVPWVRLLSGLGSIISSIPGMFAGLAGQIASTIGTIFIDVVPRFASGGIVALGQQIGSWREAAEQRVNQGARKAAGDILHGPQIILAGEEGPEAIVPLNRPLAQVDPSVRWLSAIAQGLAPPPAAADGAMVPGRTIDASGWTIITPQSDAEAVANETLVRLFASGYGG